jgi:hypothetical protein
MLLRLFSGKFSTGDDLPVLQRPLTVSSQKVVGEKAVCKDEVPSATPPAQGGGLLVARRSRSYQSALNFDPGSTSNIDPSGGSSTKSTGGTRASWSDRREPAEAMRGGTCGPPWAVSAWKIHPSRGVIGVQL